MTVDDVHQVVVWVVGTVLSGAVIATAVFGKKMLRILSSMHDFVLPHFVPPTPEEIRTGHEDNTLPTRMRRQEERLVTHLETEEVAASEMYSRLHGIETQLNTAAGNAAAVASTAAEVAVAATVDRAAHAA